MAYDENAFDSWQIGTTHGFPDPFVDMASMAAPRSMEHALRWAERIYSANGVLRGAMERVLSYFITKVVVGGENVGDDERAKYREFLDDKLSILLELHGIGADYMAYGNAFASVIVPFRRYLRCPNNQCGIEAPFRSVINYKEFQFSWNNCEFHATCPSCGFRGDWGRPLDRRAGPEGTTIKRWSPREIEIKYCDITRQKRFIWKIPGDYKRTIQKGQNLLALENCPWDIIQAIKSNQYFEFDPDFVYHVVEPSLSGMITNGWGVPRSISNLRQAWYCQVLHRFNESIALDYVVPFRTITPAPRSSADGVASDPFLNHSMSSFTSRINAMLRRRRRDPASWNVLPFPIQYQALGGEASKLAPKELLDQGLEILLNNCGVPVEFYKGNLSSQSAPTSIRLFESYWTHLIHQLNGFLAFVADKLARFLGWEEATLRLEKVTFADDLEQRQFLLQLAMGSQISKQTAFKSLSIDSYRDEIRRKLEEQAIEQEETERFQEIMETRAAGQQIATGAIPGATPPGGDPQQAAQQQATGGPGAPPLGAAGAMPGGAVTPGAMPVNPNVPVSPQEMLSKGEAIAGEWMSLPDGVRTSNLIALRKADPMLHAIVRASMERIRGQARSVGQQMVLQQQFPQSGQPAQ